MNGQIIQTGDRIEGLIGVVGGLVYINQIFKGLSVVGLHVTLVLFIVVILYVDTKPCVVFLVTLGFEESLGRNTHTHPPHHPLPLPRKDTEGWRVLPRKGDGEFYREKKKTKALPRPKRRKGSRGTVEGGAQP